MDSHEIVSDIDALADEWSALADEVGASPFAYPGWFSAWHNAFGSGSPTLVCCRRKGRLVGVLPLSQQRGNLLSLTNWHTPEYSPPAIDAAALDGMLAAAAARARGRLDLGFVDSTDAVLDACSRLAARERARPVSRVIQRSPFIDLAGEWDGFLAALSSRKRSKFNRSVRRLEEQGELSLQIDEGAGDLAGLLEKGFAVEAAAWKGEAGTAINTRPETRVFYEEVAGWAASRGWLRLLFLRVDGKPVAFGFALEHRAHHYDLKNGFDPDYAHSSPGAALIGLRLQDCFRRGLDRFEFLGAADRHKLDWTASCHDRVRIQLFSRSPQGRAEHLAWVHGRELRARVLRLAGRGPQEPKG